MLSLKSFTEDRDRLMVRPPPRGQVPTSADRVRLYFHSAFGFSTLRLAYVLDSLVRVSRRARWAHLLWILNGPCENSSRAPKTWQALDSKFKPGWTRDHRTARQEPNRCSSVRQTSNFPRTPTAGAIFHYQSVFLPIQRTQRPQGLQCTSPRLETMTGRLRWPRHRLRRVRIEVFPVRDTALIGFPFNGFTYCLTLFSKSFSPFPHGTCSLSVSCQYLALDEVYHPLKTALSSSPTRRKGIAKGRDQQPRTGLSPSVASCSKEFRSLAARTLPL